MKEDILIIIGYILIWVAVYIKIKNRYLELSIRIILISLGGTLLVLSGK